MTDTAVKKAEDKRIRNRKLKENIPDDIGTRSGDLLITHTLVDTSQRSVGVDRSAGKRVLVKRPAVVGYRIKNISESPVEITRRIYSQTEDGTYEGADTSFVLLPGESVDLSKFDAARLFGRTEFGFTAGNGYFTGAKGLDTAGGLEEYYSTRYFVATTPMSDRDMRIINTEVGLKDVAPAYLPVFGYLMEKKKPKKQKVSGRCKLESIALAEYIKKNGSPEFAGPASKAFDGSVDLTEGYDVENDDEIVEEDDEE